MQVTVMDPSSNLITEMRKDSGESNTSLIIHVSSMRLVGWSMIHSDHRANLPDSRRG